jgi:hypothetical protein
VNDRPTELALPQLDCKPHQGGGAQTVEGIMLRMIGVLALVLLVVSPALAQPRRPVQRLVRPHDPYLGYSPADPTVVATDGAYVGRDPDPNIRAQLRRFPGSYVSGGF